jgi:hypothetical protein
LNHSPSLPPTLSPLYPTSPAAGRRRAGRAWLLDLVGLAVERPLLEQQCQEQESWRLRFLSAPCLLPASCSVRPLAQARLGGSSACRRPSAGTPRHIAQIRPHCTNSSSLRKERAVCGWGWRPRCSTAPAWVRWSVVALQPARDRTTAPACAYSRALLSRGCKPARFRLALCRLPASCRVGAAGTQSIAYSSRRKKQQLCPSVRAKPDRFYPVYRVR